MHKPLLIAVLLVFGVLTLYTMTHYGGLLPWLAFYTRDPASWQVIADLVITMCLLLVFMRRDAQINGRHGSEPLARDDGAIACYALPR